MSEAEIIKVLQKMKDKQLADLIRSYIADPNDVKLLLIMAKLGITIGAQRINIIVTSSTYEERALVYQQLGGIIIDGLMYVLQIVYNPNLDEARVELIQQDGIVLQFINVGEKNDD